MRRQRFSTTDYCRCARRLRARHVNDRPRLVQSLNELSRAYDAQRPATDSVAPRHDPVQRFAQRVTDALEGATLRYSSRVKLLREARCFGIRRFDANLIIASVQERVGGSNVELREREFRAGWTSAAMLVLLIQGLILAGAGYIFAS